MILDCCREECGKIFTILTASDGKEAVDYYMQMSNIKLILMDVHMRVMDGYEATKKIREYEESLKCTKNGC